MLVGGQGAGVDRPADGATGGDHPQPGRLLHEDRAQDAARPRAEDHHVHGHQRRE